jgi:Domain of unknown function (DUF4336)
MAPTSDFPPPTLRALGPDLWEAELNLQEGMHLRMRMTVVRRANGALWLYSPIRIDAALAGELAVLGEVRDILAPNRFHRRFAATAKDRYPSATLWAAPGLAQKKPQIPFDATLSEDTDWGDELRSLFVAGAPSWSEYVFFHSPSRTLICTDLLFNIRDESHGLTRFFYRAFGMWQRFGPNRLWRWLAKDRQALAASIERILTWDIRRVVMAHGDPVEIDNPASLRAAFAPLLARSPTTARA